MKTKNCLRVILFALTGFGNTVLKALIKDDRICVVAVFTEKYDQPFPYYDETQLIDLCTSNRINCHHGILVSSAEGVELLGEYAPDLIVVATFKQILKSSVINLPPLGVINFHPSLLPRYRGPCPTNAALFNGEQETGISLHYITEKIDEGDIVLQRRIAINEADNDGVLRQKLAKLAGELVPDMVDLFIGYRKPAGFPQDNSLASTAPKPTIDDGYLEMINDLDILQRKIRAFNPLPGTSILIGNERVAVNRYELIESIQPDGIYDRHDTIELIIDSRAVRLFKRLTQA